MDKYVFPQAAKTEEHLRQLHLNNNYRVITPAEQKRMEKVTLPKAAVKPAAAPAESKS